MAKLIIHPPGTTREQIEEERLFRNLERTPTERIKLMFTLNAMALTFKKGPIKLPQGKGVILYKKGSNPAIKGQNETLLANKIRENLP